MNDKTGTGTIPPNIIIQKLLQYYQLKGEWAERAGKEYNEIPPLNFVHQKNKGDLYLFVARLVLSGKGTDPFLHLTEVYLDLVYQSLKGEEKHRYEIALFTVRFLGRHLYHIEFSKTHILRTFSFKEKNPVVLKEWFHRYHQKYNPKSSE